MCKKHRGFIHFGMYILITKYVHKMENDNVILTTWERERNKTIYCKYDNHDWLFWLWRLISTYGVTTPLFLKHCGIGL